MRIERKLFATGAATALEDARLSFSARGLVALVARMEIGAAFDIEILISDQLTPHDRAQRRKEIVQAVRELKRYNYAHQVGEGDEFVLYGGPLELELKTT